VLHLGGNASCVLGAKHHLTYTMPPRKDCVRQRATTYKLQHKLQRHHPYNNELLDHLKELIVHVKELIVHVFILCIKIVEGVETWVARV